MENVKSVDKMQLDEIYKRGRCKKLFKTIKYIYRIQSQDKHEDIVVINGYGDIAFWKKVIWHLLKYWFVSIEISSLRKKIFYMVHCSYDIDFNEKEFMKIIYNKSNWWLDCSYPKVKLFESYCEELLNDSSLCQAICELSGCTPEYYHKKNELALKDIKQVKINCFGFYEQEKTGELEKEKYFADISADLYADNFADTTLLKNDLKEDNYE